MTWDSDYAYIQVFIDFLKQIIEIIMGLFNSSSSDSDSAAEGENA